MDYQRAKAWKHPDFFLKIINQQVLLIIRTLHSEVKTIYSLIKSLRPFRVLQE